MPIAVPAPGPAQRWASRNWRDASVTATVPTFPLTKTSDGRTNLGVATGSSRRLERACLDSSVFRSASRNGRTERLRLRGRDQRAAFDAGARSSAMGG